VSFLSVLIGAGCAGDALAGATGVDGFAVAAVGVAAALAASGACGAGGGGGGGGAGAAAGGVACWGAGVVAAEVPAAAVDELMPASLSN